MELILTQDPQDVRLVQQVISVAKTREHALHAQEVSTVDSNGEVVHLLMLGVMEATDHHRLQLAPSFVLQGSIR